MVPARLRFSALFLGAALVLPAGAQYQGDMNAKPPSQKGGAAKANGKGRNLPAVNQPIYGGGRVGGYEDLPRAGFGQTYIKQRRVVTARKGADKADEAKAAAAEAPPVETSPPKKKRLKTIYRDGVKRPAQHGSLLSEPTPEE